MKIKHYVALGALAGTLGFTGIKIYNSAIEHSTTTKILLAGNEPIEEKIYSDLNELLGQEPSVIIEEQERKVEIEDYVVEAYIEEEIPKVIEDTYYEEYSDNVINFDNIYNFIDVDYDLVGDIAQSYVDQGYVAYMGGDYFHHNTSDFMNYFWQLEPGTKVIVGGNLYTCYGIEHGTSDTYNIFSDSGESLIENDTTEIFTCDGGYGTPKRWIARLQ